ncbi:restriction endonuclease subunit S [Roseobacter denitrificans]|uniref:Type I restriction enzyme specificity subunit, putative n=1 Tax=Roseobacter denitrificans (strain ATCC 33942 / OCh 114) TaxID=375451 RepID=Q167L9_ROSDO|nr:restriction endonuclease subunit S [Roseobacter denitrificans]ABG31824.1 type I restriction enzyme specificity subunit, putative [Roseobacter denitrificans OCh 114]AVL51389.1 restriction endonuclease subunit S [Roseobacter denitrificans]SFF86473.1 type I restriction enzyme, S subunit [Roseobacter denitrificans OCh 114]
MKAGWEVKPLGEVAKLHYGKALAESERSPNGTVPVYGANGVLGWSDHTLTEGPSLIVGRKGSAGEVNRVDGPFWPSDVTYYTEHDPNRLDFDYFHYGLMTLNLPSLAKGVKPGINRNDVYELGLPIPPLEEQKRIVAILDAAFERLDRAKENAEANLQNARELFDRTLERVFAELVAVHATIKLEEVTSKITKGSSPKWQGFSYVDSPGVLFVTSENVGKNELLLEKTKYVEEGFNQKDRKSILAPGDVLSNIVGASIGRTAVFDLDAVANINQAVCLMRCLPERLSPKFLSFLLNSPYFKARLHEGESNMARANLSLAFFREFLVPLPELEAQERIVQEIEELATHSAECETNYRTKLTDIADLRQSLLQKAFAGELT